MFRASNEHLCGLRKTNHLHFRARWHINALWLTAPNIFNAPAQSGGFEPFDIDINRARGRNNAGLIPRHLIIKRLTLGQFYNVEIIQRDRGIVHIHNRGIFIVKRSYMHGLLFHLCGTVVRGQKCF